MILKKFIKFNNNINFNKQYNIIIIFNYLNNNDGTIFINNDNLNDKNKINIKNLFIPNINKVK